MKTVQVYLNSIQKVIFSLDLNEPTTLNIHATDSEMGPILEAIKPYIVSEDPK